MTARNADRRLLTGPFVLAYLGAFFGALSIHAFWHLPGFVQEELEGNSAQVGLVMSTGMVSAVLCRPLVGGAIDRFGRKVVLLSGALASTGVCLLYLTVTQIDAWFLTVRALHGITVGIVWSGYFTIAADVVPPHRRQQGMALFGTAFLLPISIGGVLGDVTIEHGGYREFFWVMAVVSILQFVVVPIKETRPPLQSERGLLRAFNDTLTRRQLRPIWILGLAFALGATTYFVHLKTFLIDSGGIPTGYFFTPYAIAAIATRVVGGKLPDKLGAKQTLIPALVVLVAGLILIPHGADKRLLGLAGILCGIGHGYTYPILLALAVDRSRPSERGTVVSVYTALFDAGILFGGLPLGLIIDEAGYGAAFGAGAGIVGLATVVYIWMEARLYPQRTPRTESSDTDKKPRDAEVVPTLLVRVSVRDRFRATQVAFFRRVDALEARLAGTSSRRSQGAEAKGKVLAGRYELKGLLGEGGMSHVWRATDRTTGKAVAVKVQKLPENLPEDQQKALQLAFQQEFYTMNKLQHPNTLRVLDYLTPDGAAAAIVMEVVDGQDLAKLLERGPRPLDQIYRVLIDAAQLLGFIHSRLYVHCDIKAENIRITTGGVTKLMDFGLLHQLGTPVGDNLKGTPGYMAPEVAKGGVLDARTDFYSLGILAFELATGHLPFRADTLLEAIDAHANRPLPDLGGDLPKSFQDIVHKLCAKDPKDRFSDASSLLTALTAASGIAVEALPYAAATSYLHAAELVGRSAEQGILRERLASVRDGNAKSLFITAPAGVGKTRLLQEFRLTAKLKEVAFVTGVCRLEAQAALEPLRDALAELSNLTPRDLADEVGPKLEQTLPGMFNGRYASDDADVQVSKGEVLAALRKWLHELQKRTPFVLCLEDLHWADSATLEYMNVVIRELAGSAGMVFGTFRSNEVDRLSTLFQTVDEEISDRIEIRPFDSSQTDEFVGSMLGSLNAPGLLTRIHASTNGNAFHITETLRALIEETHLSMEGVTWVATDNIGAVAIPNTIQAVVTRRLQTLDESALRVARAVAPLGRLLRLEVVREVVVGDDKELFEVFDGLVQRQFVVRVEEGWLFSHDTVWEGIYSAMPAPERKLAHKGIANALLTLHSRSPEDVAATLAHHLELGEEWQQAVVYLQVAANDALRRRMLFDATEFLTRVATIWGAEQGDEPDDALVSVWAQIIQVAMTAWPKVCAEYAEKMFAVWEKRLDLKDAARRFHAENERLSEHSGFLNKRRLTQLWTDRPLDPASRDPLAVIPPLFIMRSMQGLCYASAGRAEEVHATIARLYEDNPNPGPFRATAFIGEAVQVMHSGQWNTLASGTRDAKSWFEAHIASTGVMPQYLWKNYAWSNHFVILEQAMTAKPVDMITYNKAVLLSKHRDYPDVRWFLEASLCLRAALLGDAEEMNKRYDQLIDMLRKMGNPRMAESRLPMWVAPYWLQRREREQADAVCTKLEFWREKLPHDAWMRQYALTCRAWYLGDWGKREEAGAAFEDALAAARELQGYRLLPQLLCAFARHRLGEGDRDAGRALAQEALDIATAPETESRWDQVVAFRDLGECTGGKEGAELAKKSVDLAGEWDMPVHEALSLFALARILEPIDRDRCAKALAASEEMMATHQLKEWLREVERFRLRLS